MGSTTRVCLAASVAIVDALFGAVCSSEKIYGTAAPLADDALSLTVTTWRETLRCPN